MPGIWSQVITLAVILQFALVSGKALIPQNQQAEQQLEKQAQYGVAEKRVGYDYPTPPHALVSPYQDDLGLHKDHGAIDEHHHDHHDPGYWKKKLIWKEGWKKIWKPAKKQIWKQIWVSDWKKIWVPGVKKIWRPVWISEWFPSPDHHEHVHESHGWDRSDKNVSDSQKLPAIQANPQEASQQQQNSPWQFPN